MNFLLIHSENSVEKKNLNEKKRIFYYNYKSIIISVIFLRIFERQKKLAESNK